MITFKTARHNSVSQPEPSLQRSKTNRHARGQPVDQAGSAASAAYEGPLCFCGKQDLEGTLQLRIAKGDLKNKEKEKSISQPSLLTQGKEQL